MVEDPNRKWGGRRAGAGRPVGAKTRPELLELQRARRAEAGGEVHPGKVRCPCCGHRFRLSKSAPRSSVVEKAEDEAINSVRAEGA